LRHRRLDKNGDYTMGLTFLTGTLAVSQAIKTNLKLLYGEWWEDKAKGLPLFQNILGQSGRQENVGASDLLIQTNIRNTTGVTGIKGFKSTFDSVKRTYTINCTVETQYGDVILGDEVIF
jgi:hypothetical protein